MSPDALRALTLIGEGVALLGRALASDKSSADSNALVPLLEAARVAGTSVRVVREAIRAGQIVAYGRQRDRAVRRSDLDAWIESRRVTPIVGPVDDDIERRMRRIARRRTKAKTRHPRPQLHAVPGGRSR